MFNAQAARRGFALYRTISTRRVIRSAIRDGHEVIHIQRVRFKKPFFTRSRLWGTALATAVVYGLSTLVEIERIEDDEVEEHQHKRPLRARQRRSEEEGAGNGGEGGLEDDDKEEDGMDEDEEDEPDGLIFFPTGFSRPKPKTFYKGSDPEWQEFVRIASDRQRLERIRDELIAIVRNLATKSPQYNLRLGKIQPEKGNTWIEVQFPDSPPTEYERPGFELTEDLAFRRTTRPVHEIHHQRLSNLLVPKPAATALYLDSKRKLEQSWKDLKIYMGWEDKAHPPAFQNMLTQFPAPSSSPRTAATSASTSPSAHSSPQQQPAGSSSSSPPSHPALEKLGFVLPDLSKAPTLNLFHFRNMLRRNHQGLRIEPPRGTFIVSGLVEIIGERAKMTLDVRAAYDPKLSRYVYFTASLRSFTEFKQLPKGGP